ncbi:hypothetical protein DBR36_01505 [Microbacterium sp. HMWF026]|uniref:hypothetical protein n=1 Tax=Microbacterium sp. HMWF026 TaxID=2056861 RepID=UPI000D39FB2B|nr:hypothetical protein [Microbacterium sp. HMWF026]PTT22611.1 hypothetical protein DBR36_01505 [Microbacterium sp. HMWF026]
MASYITANNGAGTTAPTVIDGYSTERESRNVVHDLIGGGIATTLILPRPRSGELVLHYAAEVQAWGALALLSNESAYVLTDSERPGVGMVFVVNGNVQLALDDDTRETWTVTVPYQEINT